VGFIASRLVTRQNLCWEAEFMDAHHSRSLSHGNHSFSFFDDFSGIAAEVVFLFHYSGSARSATLREDFLSYAKDYEKSAQSGPID
jgi:hypothetical protein